MTMISPIRIVLNAIARPYSRLTCSSRADGGLGRALDVPADEHDRTDLGQRRAQGPDRRRKHPRGPRAGPAPTPAAATRPAPAPGRTAPRARRGPPPR